MRVAKPSLRGTPPGWRIAFTTRVRSMLLVISALPAAMVALLGIILAPNIFGAYANDIIFWGLLIAILVILFIATGTVNYWLIIRSVTKPRRLTIPYWRRKTRYIVIDYRILLVWVESLILALVLFHAWLHVTNPYAGVSVVEQPYTTQVHGGEITVQKQFGLHVFSGPLANALGYYKSGFLIVQNTWFGSYPAPSHDTDGIVDDIHKLRFNPEKPYLISGDQFSVLYPRNLGVFYNSLPDVRTAHSEQDWQNRQRIYLQSALYALDAFSAAKKLTTTIVPVSPRTVVLTEVHPGSIPSDSLYGILYAFDQLEHADNVETAPTVRQIISERKADLAELLDIYIQDVQDPSTGLVKRGINLASARDGVVRDSSFYDNVILWKTLDLANTLGIHQTSQTRLDALRTKIMETFWQPGAGYFKDDQKTTEYSSDWLIAVTNGFLSPTNPDDGAKIERTIAYIKKERLDQPFPIKYSVTNDNTVPWAVRKFVPNYGGDAIWSFWGALYINTLGTMYHQTHNDAYRQDAEGFIAIYREKINETRGFPETFDAQGNFLQNRVYKSIRQTGWVVEFETAEAELGEFTP